MLPHGAAIREDEDHQRNRRVLLYLVRSLPGPPPRRINPVVRRKMSSHYTEWKQNFVRSSGALEFAAVAV